MNSHLTRFWTFILLCLLVAIPSTSAAQESRTPRLVLQITVDQLRGDLPGLFLDRMEDGGFRYLLEQGVVFEDAHHAHANTETIVGHATLATGAYPAIHGMIGNVWFDRSDDRLVYNIEDARYPLISADADVNRDTEIDPTQKTARSSGRSPGNLMVSTISDEIFLHSAGKAKVFGVSVKDRGAVSMAGHVGKAFWFSKDAGEFVTSSFYYDRYPEWVNTWNTSGPVEKYADKSWELSFDPKTYVFGDRDDEEWEMNFPGYGRTFPHSFGGRDSKYFTTLLTVSPVGDELTLDFAKALIDNENIGQDEITDYLSVSFSATDYVGHFFGPSSLEMEDNLLRLDRTLADLLEYIDARVGLENTLIAFSADHGGPEIPAYLSSVGIEASVVEPSEWDKTEGIAALKKRFGLGEELISSFFQPYLYLNRTEMQAKGLDAAEVEQAVVDEMNKFDGVLFALSRTDILTGRFPETTLTRHILNNHNIGRSGDIFVVFKPHRFISDFDGLTVAATHGSPWRYDTFVPVIFAGFNLKPLHVFRPIETVDLAPTLAAILGTKPPSGSTGIILDEVVGQLKH